MVRFAVTRPTSGGRIARAVSASLAGLAVVATISIAGPMAVAGASGTTTADTAPPPPPAGSSGTNGGTTGTVWLCRPGQANDPCTPSFTTTRTTPSGRVLGVDKTRAPAHPPIDCFYVYPTVSDQKTPNADLSIDPTEKSIALYQAARYSLDCRVFAPVYRQVTLSSITGGAAGNGQLAYDDVRQAWTTYLSQFNHGRGVVLIGHSQGSFVLRQLISSQIDPKPAVRRLLVSAVLLGGNVTVRKGSDVGGDFKHVRACHRATQTGCVIAFSTFDATPPPDSLFGRTTTPGLQVLCTNPAALGGGSGTLDPVFPTQPFAPGSTLAAGIKLLDFSVPAVSTPWVSAPGAYRAKCSSAGGAHVLEITPRQGAPMIHPSPDATWGLHLVDGNIALGNLVAVVHTEAAAYVRAHGTGGSHS